MRHPIGRGQADARGAESARGEIGAVKKGGATAGAKVRGDTRERLTGRRVELGKRN